MNPTAAFEAWLVDYLKDDATLSTLVEDRVYTNVPPADREFPCVVIALSTGSESYSSLSGTPHLERLVYEIVVLHQKDDISLLVGIADRLETLLAGYVADETGFKARILRSASVERQNALYGITRYTRLGAEWRVMLQIKG